MADASRLCVFGWKTYFIHISNAGWSESGPGVLVLIRCSSGSVSVLVSLRADATTDGKKSRIPEKRIEESNFFFSVLALFC